MSGPVDTIHVGPARIFLGPARIFVGPVGHCDHCGRYGALGSCLGCGAPNRPVDRSK